MFTNNILVTGGAGYIGSHIIELLIKKNLNNSLNLITDFILEQSSSRSNN